MNFGQLLVLEPYLLEYEVDNVVFDTLFLKKGSCEESKLQRFLYYSRDEKLEDLRVTKFQHLECIDEFIISIKGMNK